MEHAEAARSEFVPEYPLVLHWDEKILPENYAAGNVDHMPVLIAGDGVDKLLSVVNLASETEYNGSMAAHNLLEL